MRFTADEAQEAHESGEPILIDAELARQICREHGVLYDDYLSDETSDRKTPRGGVDAWLLLCWLGY